MKYKGLISVLVFDKGFYLENHFFKHKVENSSIPLELRINFKTNEIIFFSTDLLFDVSDRLKKLEKLMILRDLGIENSVEYEEKELKQRAKEKMKDKDFGSIAYTNPRLTIDPTDMPKKYLKWEDLRFTDDEQKLKVKLNGEDYTIVYFIEYPYDSPRGYEYVGILKNEDLVIYSIFTYWNFTDYHKQFFDNLHLEVIK